MFLQEAGNGEHGVHERDNTLQLTMEVNRLICEGRSLDQASKEMEAGHAERAGQGMHMARFAAAWGGGADGPMLRRADDFGKSMPARREIEARQLSLLADARCASYPQWIEACVCALSAAPACFCKKLTGEAALFDEKDIAKIGKELKDTRAQARAYLFTYLACMHYTHLRDASGIQNIIISPNYSGMR